MKKLLSLLVAFVVVLAGCGSSSVDLEHEGDGVLTIWSFFEGAPKIAADYYSEQTGTEIDYQTIAYGDFQTKLNTVIGTDDAPDIVILERGFMGSYLSSDDLVSVTDLMGDSENFANYVANTATPTEGPGTYGDDVKAIGWENTASAFFYRTDLASQCLDINSVEEMEAATQSVSDYATLYDQLKNSDDETCSNMALLAGPDYATGLLQNVGLYEINEDGTYDIPAEFGDTLDDILAANESGAIYSPQNDKTQIVNGAANDGFLGNISLAWATQAVEEYEQPGQWAIADTPLDYTAGGSFMAVTSNADMELAKDFLDQTFLNEDWLVDNMESFGMVGNETVMNKYLETTDGTNDYYGGQNTVEKFAQINDGIDYYVPVTPYDVGIGTAISETLTAYADDKTITTTDEAIQMLKDKILSVYPDVTVTADGKEIE